MALSKDTPLTLLEGLLKSYPIYRALRAFEGSMIFRKSDGYACLTAAGNPFLGHAWAPADNRTGNDGDLEVLTRNGPYRAQVTLASVALTDVGKQVYASDDATLTLTATSNTLVGKVERYVAVNTCVVEFQPVGVAVTTVVQQAHIADALAAYTTPGLDTEAELIVAINAHGVKINAILTALESAGVVASS